MRQKNVRFLPPKEYDEQQLVNDLTQRYQVDSEPAGEDLIAFYDTFDWRLFNRSLVLMKVGSTFHLRRLYEGTTQKRADVTGQPVFIWEFPNGPLKAELEPIIEIRALMKLAEVCLRSRTYRILDKNDKTVVRLITEEAHPIQQQNGSPVATYLWLKPVRGYPKHAQKVAEQLSEIGFNPAETKDLFFDALAHVGKTPGDYSSKFNIELDSNMRADKATKAILRSLFDTIKRNAPYVKQDLDIEFLHDFRVAIRRTRSALSQIKAVFPAETTAHFKRDFKTVGKLTNDLRDLDVYLLYEPTYRETLPDVVQDHIDLLFAHLRKKRAAALKKVVDGLNSEEYARIMADWERFLTEPATGRGSKGDRPIIALAQKRIYKRYRRIIKFGHRILDDSRDEMLHSLRIECKELRYLMEFFSSLFPAKEITRLIKQLKLLQKNLGEFNDLDVQMNYLQRTVEELPLTDPGSRQAILAIGSLVEKLDSQKQTVKASFVDVFIRFASAKNQALFKQLFAK